MTPLDPNLYFDGQRWLGQESPSPAQNGTPAADLTGQSSTRLHTTFAWICTVLTRPVTRPASTSAPRVAGRRRR